MFLCVSDEMICLEIDWSWRIGVVSVSVSVVSGVGVVKLEVGTKNVRTLVRKITVL